MRGQRSYPEWGKVRGHIQSGERSRVRSRGVKGQRSYPEGGRGQRSYPEWGERSEVISRGVRGPGLPRLRESPEFLAVSSSAPHPR